MKQEIGLVLWNEFCLSSRQDKNQKGNSEATKPFFSNILHKCHPNFYFHLPQVQIPKQVKVNCWEKEEHWTSLNFYNLGHFCHPCTVNLQLQFQWGCQGNACQTSPLFEDHRNAVFGDSIAESDFIPAPAAECSVLSCCHWKHSLDKDKIRSKHCLFWKAQNSI